jgi:hypothetical protein
MYSRPVLLLSTLALGAGIAMHQSENRNDIPL